MARGKKQPKPKLSDFLGLDWHKQDPEIGDEVFDQCSFCHQDIKVTESYYRGDAPAFSMSSDFLFYACIRCVQEAGLQW